MNTVVLGAPGQLGRDLCPLLPGDVRAFGRADVDLTDPVKLASLLAAERPDVVLNCAAYNLVDQAESAPLEAYRVNALAVRELARICAHLDCTLVHFSTDYVFGGDFSQDTPLSEEDLEAPVSIYGMSKLAGEAAVRRYCPKHIIVRTCGLYGLWGSGGKGGNFIETMLRLARAGKPIRVVNDQRCTPSFTSDVADAVVALLDSGRFGLFHVTNADDCTWFELAGAIFKLAGEKVDIAPISSAEFGAMARRPAYSVLSNRKLLTLGIKPLRPWSEALADYLARRAQRTN